ncbi:hypothetical protein ARAM_005992 [Aspergillus terreus]|uniref:Uncharacterized protein n=1 Tax=Aspergillus terreus TaxID=33178 RepID=A0A5M3Z9L1_ASPTE|nr:hypothetical protein ATETN484_0012027800 [Aspergillus terreus]GFF19526.1 hypothetical protein ARAM_005992 [Aspergillus terreus]
MSRLTGLDFRDTLTDAINEHNAEYAAVYSLSIRWASDDARTVAAATQFQNILEMLRVPDATELTLDHSDRPPGLRVQEKLRELLASAKRTTGRALVIVHYAGQGVLTRNSPSVDLCDRLNIRRFEAFDADTFLVSLALPGHYDLRDTANVDVLFVFDCKYFFGLPRPPLPNPGTHVVEVLAAVEEEYSPADPSLTEYLRKEIAGRQEKGAQYVEVADLVQTLWGRSSMKMTTNHSVKLGASSICLPLAGLKEPVHSPSIAPSVRALLTVQIADNVTREQLDQLVSFIRDAGPDIRLTLQGICPC